MDLVFHGASGAPHPDADQKAAPRGGGGTSGRAGFKDGQADSQVVSSPSCIKELGSRLGFDLGLRLGKLETSFYLSLSPNSVDLLVVFFSEWLVIFA